MKFRITIKIEVFNTKFSGEKVDKDKISRFFRGMLVVLSILFSPMLQQLTWTGFIDSSPAQSGAESLSYLNDDSLI